MRCSYWSVNEPGRYPVLMRKRADNSSRDEVVVDQNDIALSHSYVGVVNERVTRDSGQVRVAFAVDTEGCQRWQVMKPRRRSLFRCILAILAL